MTKIILMGLVAAAGIAVAQQDPVRLWDADVPGAFGKAEHDVPTLTPFLADPAKSLGGPSSCCLAERMAGWRSMKAATTPSG